MTPQEHYAEAERLVEAAKSDVRAAAGDALAEAQRRALVALDAARVHAALAAVSQGVDPLPTHHHALAEAAPKRTETL